MKKIVTILLLLCIIFLPTAVADTVGGTTFDTSLVADKTVYPAGSAISYRLWTDLTSTSGNDIDHCIIATFTLDQNIENIAHNMPAFCTVNGNQVKCQDDGSMWFWFTPSPFHDYMRAQWLSTPFEITGTIKNNVAPGTTIKSTSSVVCYLVDPEPNVPYPPSVYDISESVVQTSGSTNAPEFPSVYLPVTFILGILGITLLIQRTKEH